MADKEKPKKLGFHEEFGWFIWGFVILGVAWFFTGGLERQTSHEGAFIKPLAPVNSGEIYGNYYAGTDRTKQTLDLPEAPTELIKKAESTIKSFFLQAREAREAHLNSLLSKRLSFDGSAQAKATDPNLEYIKIIASEYSKTLHTLSGLYLRGYGYDTNLTIPKASEMFVPGSTVTKTDVQIAPGGQAIITSGRSPIGTSFRVNMCSGYLDQYQTFTPAFKKDCPDPLFELGRKGLLEDRACVNFVEDLPRCRVYPGEFPENLSQSCKDFVSTTLNYNTCVLDHKTNQNFFSNEWRIFLDQTKEIWKNKNEIIKLVDINNNTLDAITY